MLGDLDTSTRALPGLPRCHPVVDSSAEPSLTSLRAAEPVSLGPPSADSRETLGRPSAFPT